MPATTEQETVVEVATPAAIALKASTDAAVKAVTGGGFSDPEFEKSLQAAIDKDLGKAPAEPEKKVEPEAKVEPEKKVAAVEIPDDIPAELLGEKKVEKADPAKDDAAKAEVERQKFLEEQTKGMTPKAAERFKKIELRAYDADRKAKQLEASLESEKTTLKKQIEDLSLKVAAKVEPPAETEAMKKRVAELEEMVSKAALTEDPRFKARYDGQIEAEIETAKKLVPTDKADEFGELLALPSSKKRTQLLKELTEGMDDFERSNVLISIRNVDTIAAAKAKELANWKENKIHVEARQLEQQQQDQKTNSEKLRQQQEVAWAKGMAVVSSPETGMEVFRKANGADEWNAKVDQRIVSVQRILSNPNMEPEKLVEMAAKSVAADDYRQLFLAQRTLVQKLASELADLKKAEPSPADDGGDGGEAPDTDDFVTAAVKGSVKAGALR